METVKRILKPTPFLWLCLVGVFLLDYLVMTSGSYSMKIAANPDSQGVKSADEYRVRGEFYYGVAQSVVVVSLDDESTTEVRWARVFLTLLGYYLLAAVVSRGVILLTGLRHPTKIFAGVTLGIVAITFFVSIGISRYYWGYFFSRPAVFPEFEDIISVAAVVDIKTTADENGNRRIEADDPTYHRLSRDCASCDDAPYYCLEERLLLALQDRDLLPTSATLVLPDLPEMHALIRSTGILAEAEEGYDLSESLHGYLIDAIDHRGRRLVIVGANGGAVSNDHFPHYEMLFTGETGSTDLNYERGQRFFYDIAGLEGMEWFGIWASLSMLCLIFGMPLTILLLATWRAIRRFKQGRRESHRDTKTEESS